ncbi:MAG: glycosyltransferase family 1 protein [bacterium]
MKIGIDAHAVGTKVGGNELYIHSLINELAKIDKENEYILYTSNPKIFKKGLVQQKNFKTHLVLPFSRWICVPISLPLELLKNPVDLLHVQYIAPPICPKPFVVTIHDTSWEYFPEYYTKIDYIRLSKLVPFTLKRAEKIIAVAENIKNELIELYGIHSSKIVVTYNGVNNQFYPIKDPNQILKVRMKYNLPERFLLYVGIMRPVKNIPRLIEAFYQLKKNHNIEHKLVIVGEKGWLYSDIFKTVQRLGLEEEIVFTGYIENEQLPLLYNAAELFVFPSIREASPLPPIEAMACGTPMVVSSTSSFPEIVGDAALMVNPYSIDEIAKAIYDVLSNPELQKTMSEKGIKRAKSFSWENTARKTLAVYEECISR